MRIPSRIVVIAACALSMSVLGGTASDLQAQPMAAAQAPAAVQSFFVFPSFFPPFADAGTVVELSGDGETCLAWQADSNGALYFFTGLDDFIVGARLYVRGKLCLICLTTLTCGYPVSPILSAQVMLLK